jgi:hypothetical protein
MENVVKILSILAIAILMASCGEKEDEKIFSETLYKSRSIGGLDVKTPYGHLSFECKNLEQWQPRIGYI